MCGVWVGVAETPGLCATSFRSRAAGSYCPNARQVCGTETGNSVADCERLQVKGSLLCLERRLSGRLFAVVSECCGRRIEPSQARALVCGDGGGVEDVIVVSGVVAKPMRVEG